MGGGLAVTVTLGATLLMCFFAMHSSYVSSLAYSSPSIVIEAGRTQGGTRILYDDYREAYYWLRHNTDPDAKIMSWWDYGYQVGGGRKLWDGGRGRLGGSERGGEGEGGGTHFSLALSRLAIEHASLSKRSSLPTPNRDTTSNIWTLRHVFSYTVLQYVDMFC